jgi:hypothetical protein
VSRQGNGRIGGPGQLRPAADRRAKLCLPARYRAAPAT